MAILLRRLLLRHRTAAFSLLRTGSISSFSVVYGSIPSPPAKALYSPRWQCNLSRRFSSASPDMDSERLFSAKESEECLPRGLEAEDIEGCDFNHWLVVVNFPKNPRPSPEEMIRSYEETCAKALNLSLEEAKKKIYATSTSNYTGFHVQVSETESNKFNGQPGVVFVLPDSYIDKENKEYGGDKYINGVIIPRPRVSRRRIWDNVTPPTRQQVDRSNSQDQSATSSYTEEQQRNSPPYTHEGVRRRSTNVAPPSRHPPPQPPPQQSYYTPPPPNHPFQHNNYNHVPPSTRNPFQQEKDSFAPNRWNYREGVMWNYAPPPPLPPPPPPPHFNWHHHSLQVGLYPWTVDRGYPGPAHGPHPPNWPDQPHPGQPSQCQVYQNQPYPRHSSQTQVFPGQPDPGQPSQSQVYEGQHYPGHSSQSQVYRSQPDPGQPGQSQVYEGQHYPGHSSQSQVYRSQPDPGQPSQSQVYEGQHYPGHSSQSQVNRSQPDPGQPSQSQVYEGQPPYPSHSSQNRVYQGQPNPGQPSQSLVYEGQPYPGQNNERRGYGPNGDYQEYGSQYGPLVGYWR